MLPAPLQQVDRIYVLYKKRKLSYFAGCDYYRLASHPEVLQAAHKGIEEYGLNVSASRLTTGNHPLYDKLESCLARFFNSEAAVLTSNGYTPNIIVAQALSETFTHVLLDDRAHGSLVDAACFLNCPVVRFKHSAPEDLIQQIQKLGKKIKPILFTDGVFSLGGAIAPLREYLAALPDGGMILLDDAHGAGVLGKMGRGTAEFAGVRNERIIQTITLSKAFGTYGGAILCSREMKERIFSKSRLAIGNTPLPLPLANAAIKSLQILKSDRSLRQRLAQNVQYAKETLIRNGFAIELTPTPILLLQIENHDADHLKRQFLSKGVFPSFIRYPGGPENGFFRFTLSSEHSKSQLDDLLGVMVSYIKSQQSI